MRVLRDRVGIVVHIIVVWLAIVLMIVLLRNEGYVTCNDSAFLAINLNNKNKRIDFDYNIDDN